MAGQSRLHVFPGKKGSARQWRWNVAISTRAMRQSVYGNKGLHSFEIVLIISSVGTLVCNCLWTFSFLIVIGRAVALVLKVSDDN